MTGAATFTLAYPPASTNQKRCRPDPSRPSRRSAGGGPVQRLGYTNTPDLANPPNTIVNGAIKLTSGNFVNNDIYEFSYIAKNPTVNGLGLAAIRDFNSFLRFASHDDVGTPNPLGATSTASTPRRPRSPAEPSMTSSISDSTRTKATSKVFDGMMQWIAAGDGLNMNYRWSQTKRTNRNRQELLYLEGLYPFANVPTFDPISSTSDWRYKRCEQTHTCPLAMEFYSANEFWVKAGSLMSTDPTGRFDLPDHPLTRLYLLSSKQHGGAGDPTSKGVCQQFLNPLDSAPVQRALWIDLDDWSTRGIQPPDSRGAEAPGSARWCRPCRRPASASRTFRASPTPA